MSLDDDVTPHTAQLTFPCSQKRDKSKARSHDSDSIFLTSGQAAWAKKSLGARQMIPKSRLSKGFGIYAKWAKPEQWVKAH